MEEQLNLEFPCVERGWIDSELWFFGKARLEFTGTAKLCFAENADRSSGLFSS
jgi:hypothetical protein